jgi:5-(carboxyamino)imidazole ribonucleotide synthase
MLALAGFPLGLRFRFLDPAPDAPAGRLAEHIAAAYDDADALERFARDVSVVTAEFENVPAETARRLAGRAPVYPPPEALDVAQDRLAEKTFFQQLGIPTPRFAPVCSRAELEAAVERIGLPAVLKTRRLGYDGKGQAIIRGSVEIDHAWAALCESSLILEGFVSFEREVSILAVRGRDGAIAFYPLIENHHRDGILRLSLAPAPGVTPKLQSQAEGYATRALNALNYVGVLAIELFEAEGQLIANEMAPRVHNSGHWTIDAAETSQFENHLRAILGLPLGSTAPMGHAAMINLIGGLPDPWHVLAVPGAHLHRYGKSPRPGRKLGHITLRADDRPTLAERLSRLQALVGATA